jgi:DNA polymerase
MTAAEKNSLAHFLDLAAAVTGSGYRLRDDPLPMPEETAETTAEHLPEMATEAAPPDNALPVVASGDTSADSLESVAADVCGCTACKLSATRTNAVPGEGARRPLVMVIGEGPGADEDATGRPFVGKAGHLLDKMLASIGLSRESNCYIANVIKCRPPENRDPQPDETAACASFLQRQIQLLQPRFILCAGKIAAQTLLNTSNPIGKLRGKFFDFKAGDKTIPFLPTYHPSALLRNEDWKRPAWEDLKLLRSKMDSERGIGSSEQ